WSQYPYDPADFGQIFRVNWTGKSNDVVTTKIQYEDVSATHRQGLVIVSYEWSSVISTAITGGYHRNEIRELSISSERKSYWFGRFGLEATL
ncbi:MAG: hypothetical protein NT027_15505, partial [Proteobacteria bacterium]|nr:hypothetical protein [Pseudomonadota bacterium]